MGHIDLQHVALSLPDGRVLLDDVSFRVGEGARAAIVGANGAGKTTLLGIISGDRAADSGSVTPGVETICRITPRPPLRVIAPACGMRSPVTIRSNVVFPAPLAPTSATFAPSPTRNDTSSSSTRPSGSSNRTPETST